MGTSVCRLSKIEHVVVVVVIVHLVLSMSVFFVSVSPTVNKGAKTTRHCVKCSNKTIHNFV